MLILAFALAKPSVEDSAAILLSKQAGIEVTSLEEMPDTKGWFTWHGTRAGQPCSGSVHIDKRQSDTGR